MNSCGSLEGDSFDQAFVVHHVRVGVFVELLAAFPQSPLPSLFEDQKGTAAPKCYGMIAMFTHCLVNPFGLLQDRTMIIEKYKGTFNSPVVLLAQFVYSFILPWSFPVCVIIQKPYIYHLPPHQSSRYTSQQIHDGYLSTSLTIASVRINTIP